MKLNELGAPEGANKKTKRRGRGSGSGHGKNACRGRKGAWKRSGRTTRPGFEGGQMPLIRRIPKRGFTAPFKSVYQVVNVESLNKFDNNAVVGPLELKKAGLIASDKFPVKILGTGTLKKSITVKAHKFSESSKKLFQDAGAKIEILGRHGSAGVLVEAKRQAPVSAKPSVPPSTKPESKESKK